MPQCKAQMLLMQAFEARQTSESVATAAPGWLHLMTRNVDMRKLSPIVFVDVQLPHKELQAHNGRFLSCYRTVGVLPYVTLLVMFIGLEGNIDRRGSLYINKRLNVWQSDQTESCGVPCRATVQHLLAGAGETTEANAGSSVPTGHMCVCGCLPQLKRSCSSFQHGCHCLTSSTTDRHARRPYADCCLRLL